MMTEKIENLLVPNKQNMAQHLNFLFSALRDYSDGKIEIAYTDLNGKPNRAEYFDFSDIEKAVEFAARMNAQTGVNVYVGAALRNPETPLLGRSDISDYYVSSVAWVDIDDEGQVDKAKALYKDMPPSLVVVTGRAPYLRAQFWWTLMIPELAPDPLKEALGIICSHFSGDTAVVDPARIMRLGGSIAWPYKKGRDFPELTEVFVPDSSTKIVSLERLMKEFPPSKDSPVKAAGAATNFRNPFTGNLQIEKLLEATRIEGQWHVNMRDAVASMIGHGWPDEAIRLATNPYLRDNSLKSDMITPLINSGREKFGKPEIVKEPIITETHDPETGEIKSEVRPPKNNKKLPLIYANDIKAVTDTSDFVEDLLRDEEFSVIYGQSNCGKTFFMLDLAMHVALGLPWRGKEVEQGGVIYAALEGGHGTKNRIVAFKEHYQVDADIPLAIIPSSINFLDEENDMPAFVQAVVAAKEKLGSVRLIVIDTLSRAISGGDENSSSDMGALIINADMLRKITGAHICFIHHSGKDDLKGARGHSSLRAAVDTEIEISRPDTESPSNIKIVKQREMEMTEEMGFSLKRIVLGVNKRGKEVTSCIVLPSEIVENKKTVKLNPIQTFIYDALLEAMIRNQQMRNLSKDMPPVSCVSYDELRLVMEERGFKEMMATEEKTSAQQVKSATQTARLALKKHGKVNFGFNYIWPIYEDEK